MWGEKGEEYRPDMCIHGPDDGCMWCCERCNHDAHRCHGCGTVSDHHDTTCPECVMAHAAAGGEPPVTDGGGQ